MKLKIWKNTVELKNTEVKIDSKTKKKLIK